MEGDEGNEIILRQVKYFKKSGQSVHVQLKDGRFRNGVILEHEGDMILVEDKMLGATPIYFLEIRFIEKERGLPNG